jgi:malonate transporter and related proteins
MVFEVIIPIFILLALGYLAVKLNVLDKTQVDAIGSFVIKIALPALMFQSLASKDFSEIWLPDFFLVFAVAAYFCYVLGFYISTRHFKQRMSQASILALGASMSNTGLLGTAVLSLLLGTQAMTYIMPILIFESVLLIPTVLILIELGGNKGASVVAVFRSTFLMLLQNPLFVGVVVGILFAVLHIPIPSQLNVVLDMLGHSASPLALFAIGGGIVGMSLKYLNLQTIYLVLSNNVLMPVLVYLGLRYGVNASQEMLYAGTIIAALPMPTIFAIMGQLNGLKDEALTPLLVSTIVGFTGVSLLIALWYG